LDVFIRPEDVFAPWIGMPWVDLEANRTIFFKLLAPRPLEKILDVGAGHGAVANLVRSNGNSEVYAADPDKKRIAKMQKVYPLLKSCLADAETLPYPDAYFDKVYTTVAMHHFSDQRRAIQEFARVLKPTGLLLIVEIQPRSRQGRLLRFFENGIMRSHLKFLEMDQLAGTVRDQGGFEAETLISNSYVYFVECTRRIGS
jgi:ubiquinone/menaquinone biosynthesis C-methylase UbiE